MSKKKELKKKRKKAKQTIEEILTIQDFLYENTTYYILDYQPDISIYTKGMQKFYYEDGGYEDWLDEKYLPIFADAVTKIAFELMQYNYSEVYLDPVGDFDTKYKKYVGYNIRKIGLAKLDEIIHHIILDWQDNMTIKFIDRHHNIFFMEIKDEWETTFTNLRGDNLKLIKKISKAEGLFLTKCQYDEMEYIDAPKSWLDKTDKKWKKFYS